MREVLIKERGDLLRLTKVECFPAYDQWNIYLDCQILIIYNKNVSSEAFTSGWITTNKLQKYGSRKREKKLSSWIFGYHSSVSTHFVLMFPLTLSFIMLKNGQTYFKNFVERVNFSCRILESIEMSWNMGTKLVMIESMREIYVKQ